MKDQKAAEEWEKAVKTMSGHAESEHDPGSPGQSPGTRQSDTRGALSSKECFTVAALRARFADESMPWTRPHVESLISQIAELTKQRDEGWNNFYALRKQVAAERYPGMTASIHAHETTDGYKDAFYQISDLLGLPAMPISPKESFEMVMLPRLRELLAVKTGGES